MKTSETTMLLPAPAWSDPRVHLLDDSWLLTIFAILIATALPWAASDLRIDLPGTSLGLLALAAIHVAFSALINPARAPTARRAWALSALHVLGVIVVGFVWHHAGGLQNPAFLLAFALPVVGAIFLSRRQPYLVATAAILTVCVVALLEAPELRWYVSGLNGAGGWLAAIFGGAGASSTPPFPGLYAPTGYFIVMLEVFAVVLLGCAIAAEYLGTVFDRLHAHVLSSQVEAERAQELWKALIEHLPLPTLLVDADTLQVVCASHSVAPHFCDGQEPPIGRNLFDAVGFSYPEAIQELIAGAGGLARLSVIHVDGRLRVTDVRVQHMAQRGRRFAVAVIEDRTEAFCVKAALDVAEQATLVLDGGGNVLALNKPVHTLLPDAQIGANVSRLLAGPGATTHWWEPSLAGRVRMRVEIKQRDYQVTTSALALPGEEERIYVVAFQPIARGTATDHTALTATRMHLS